MVFARRLFLVAGVYGILVLFPMYFLEARLSEQFPPPVTHPELYYGFVGTALAWQLVYLLISRDPVRYRPLMVLGAFSKLSYGLAVAVLFALGRTATFTLLSALPDLALAALFLLAFGLTGAATRSAELLALGGNTAGG
jgi:hypothetical protein